MALFLLFREVILFLLSWRRRVRTWGLSIARTVLPAAMFLVPSAVSGLTHDREEGSPAESDAASLYRRYCQRCHGADGTGRGTDDAPNFTRHAWQKERDDAELLVSVLDGKGTGMPSFQDRLSETQARSLVAHIRTFAPAPAGGSAKSIPSTRMPKTDFARQFRGLQDEFEELQRQLRELDSIRQSQSKSTPRNGARHTSSGEGSPQNHGSAMPPETHNRASSTADGQGRASGDDRQEPPEPEGLAVRLRPLLTAKCAQCHGEHLSRPKGKFGYVLDLERVCRNPKLVVPFRPEESKLWRLIRDNKMPPEGCPVGPLTAEEKEVVRDWIAAGTPIALTYTPPSDDDPPSLAAVSSPPPAAAPTSLHRHLGWLGRFHIPAIHFPIAMFLAAAAGEFWCMLRRIRDPWPTVRFCVLLGAAGSALAAALGWLHADIGGYGAGSPALLGLHRWLGTLGSCSAAAAAVASEIDSRRHWRSLLFRLTLFAAALLIGAAGHFGGSLVHGDDFFAW